MAVINTNFLSLTVQNQKNKSSSALNTAIERLASGIKVNSAKDNAAGQAISNRMTSQTNGLLQATNNAGDGISLVQTAQGVLDEINERLQRIRTLAVQGLNETNSLQDADKIQSEINLNLKEIDRLNSQSGFNGRTLLDGSIGKLDLQVGVNDGETISLDFSPPGFGVDALGLTDLVIRGISGKVFAEDSVVGTASNIVLNSATTSTSYSLSGGSLTSPTLVRSNANNQLYIQDMDAQGKPIYYAASYSASHDTTTGQSAVQINAITASPLYSSVSQIASRTVSAAAINFVDADGASLNVSPSPSLVESDGKYFIEQDGEYFAASLSFSRTGGFLARITDGTSLSESDFPTTPTTVSQTPAIDLSTTSLTFSDSSGTSISADNARLLQRGGQYFIEVDDGAGNYQYYNATVTVTTDGADVQVSVAAGSAAAANSFTEVSSVSGTSYVTLDPANVEVRYTDSEGNIYSDVLSSDADGNYIMNISDGGNSDYKSATIVRQEDNSFLLKTINGNGEVQIYYGMDFTAYTDAGTNHTVLNISEVGEEIRLRNPEDPLATLDRAIGRVDEKRGALGAMQNRLESVISVQSNTFNNISTSRARIMDADYAVEVSNMTKSQLLQQSSSSLLAQANQLPDTVLALLKE
ncbi:flagellin [Brenneria tiliae]|uniref:Flagellin n=1 Tax=Brenneria tiliae TaxID=2914984 RepID=A0ABT0MZR1_9GAMM|nr:flagellin [Brenneria tiliae]MCL2895336.1 hypothetical protein [Brenneria tiliae]